jgi:hypothetical protein
MTADDGCAVARPAGRDSAGVSCSGRPTRDRAERGRARFARAYGHQVRTRLGGCVCVYPPLGSGRTSRLRRGMTRPSTAGHHHATATRKPSLRGCELLRRELGEVREDRHRWRAQAERLSSTRPCLSGRWALTSRSPSSRPGSSRCRPSSPRWEQENATLRAVADKRREDFASATAPTS